MITVDGIKSIYHAVEKVDLIQACPVCGTEYGRVDLFVRFTFNDPNNEAYILGKESESPILCCGRSITLFASFSDEKSADAAMNGYADICIALGRASPPSLKYPIDSVIPFFPLKEVIDLIRNPS